MSDSPRGSEACKRFVNSSRAFGMNPGAVFGRSFASDPRGSKTLSVAIDACVDVCVARSAMLPAVPWRFASQVHPVAAPARWRSKWPGRECEVCWPRLSCFPADLSSSLFCPFFNNVQNVQPQFRANLSSVKWLHESGSGDLRAGLRLVRRSWLAGTPWRRVAPGTRLVFEGLFRLQVPGFAFLGGRGRPPIESRYQIFL